MAAFLNAQNCLSFASDHGDVTRLKNLEQAISVISCLRGHSISLFRGTIVKFSPSKRKVDFIIQNGLEIVITKTYVKNRLLVVAYPLTIRK